MQLSSVLLAATALLAHTTSGFHLRPKTDDRDIHGAATARNGFVGFDDGGTEEENDAVPDERVDITLVGGEMQGGFVSKQEGSEPGLWVFKKGKDGETLPAGGLTGPFEVTGDGLFRWAGDGVAKWRVCDFNSSGFWTIYLGMDDWTQTDLQCYAADLFAWYRE